MSSDDVREAQPDDSYIQSHLSDTDGLFRGLLL